MPSQTKTLKNTRHLHKISDLSPAQSHEIILKTLELKARKMSYSFENPSPILALVFLEPSTRTRFSFEMACRRLGIETIVFSLDNSTSASKGESLHETLSTILAMCPDGLILRSPKTAEISAILSDLRLPFVNAGYGAEEHPTQALLDAVTIFEKRRKIKGERVVFVGDIEHSRVANSTAQLLISLGAEVAYCAPTEMQPQSDLWRNLTSFSSLSDAMKWANVCIGLRMQTERHSASIKNFSIEKYIQNFRIDPHSVKDLASDGLIMHPGPFVPGVDLVDEILTDPRCMIHDQVTNGVFVRSVVIGELFGTASV